MKLLLRNTELKHSLLRNSLVQIFWWIVFFPGFFSGDSFAAVDMAKSGELTNSYTASWAIYVRLFSFHGHAIALLTLVNGLLLTYSITRFAYSVMPKKNASIASFIIILTPLAWGMGITLWHDIPMTSGFLILTAIYTEVFQKNSLTKFDLYLNLILGSILITFRPNGLPTLVVFGILFFIINRNRNLVRLWLLSAVTALLTILITSYAIVGMSPINNYYAQEWMRNDISCFANSAKGEGFVEANIPSIGTTETWRSNRACTFLNDAKITQDQKVAAQRYVPGAWRKLFLSEPGFILSTHTQRNAYLIPLPIYGIPKPPFLHSTIEFQDQEIVWAFPALAENARIAMRLWNALSGLLAWAGLWLLSLIAFAIWKAPAHLYIPISMAISSTLILFVFSPIPDGRYTLPILLMAQIYLIGNTTMWAQTGSNRRPTD
jgi:4-amino-4-deoxy-L-arabinose transferase-like glycosyltransferase